jgi:hypothetical protein
MVITKNSLNNANIKEKDGKVTVNLKNNEIKKKDVEDMANRCRTGNHSCCGPEFFDNVDDFSVTGKDSDVSINISGKGINKKLIEKNLKTCDCVKDDAENNKKQ